MILCHCAVVDDAQVAGAVEQGAHGVREVLLRTGAGRGCGGCVPAIRECVEQRLCQGGHHARTVSSEVLHAAG